MEDVAPAILGICFFASVVLSLYYYFKARNKERMALIEKGIAVPSQASKRKKNGTFLLKIGIFFIGVSVGLFAGYLLATFTIVDDVVSYFSMILFFGGLSLLLYYIISLKDKGDKAID